MPLSNREVTKGAIHNECLTKKLHVFLLKATRLSAHKANIFSKLGLQFIVELSITLNHTNIVNVLPANYRPGAKYRPSTCTDQEGRIRSNSKSAGTLPAKAI